MTIQYIIEYIQYHVKDWCVGIFVFMLFTSIIVGWTVVFETASPQGIIYISLMGYENPTFEEMCTFITDDTTEMLKYHKDTFNCEDFSNTLIDNARAKGYRCGYVTMNDYRRTYTSTNDKLTGHAIVCFETSDKGLYFVEPQGDYIVTEAQMDEMMDNECWSPSRYCINPPEYSSLCLTVGWSFFPRGYQTDWYRLT